MSHMIRSLAVRAVTAGTLAAAGGALLVGCGSDDSTATSTPTTSASASSAPATSAEASKSEDAPAATPSEAATAPAEEPESVPSDFPGPTEVPISDKGREYLDALEAKGVQPAGDGSIAVATGDYICQAQAAGQDDATILVFVTAAVGSEASAAGTELSADQAGMTAKTYVDVARASYCG
ncbi:DUF732 domain-containing protein [Rhodococcus sp. HNM0569]|uniref:DUF732 domain-containing protein n=1 Tax=Rhodococcus sp. HNM0569 TaxID=2716340 RepID=UPI00146C4AA0|nr:DUF732 domain-containing protein [Rhodococcus sp. HNM0569]NLU84788.1 DUF732 domain-containing protein [Rhodococcus sp. HNM0569]